MNDNREHRLKALEIMAGAAVLASDDNAGKQSRCFQCQSGRDGNGCACVRERWQTDDSARRQTWLKCRKGVLGVFGLSGLQGYEGNLS